MSEEYLKQELDVKIMTGEDEIDPCVYVKFTGFKDIVEADEYADQLIETLPLLLFETKQVH